MTGYASAQHGASAEGGEAPARAHRLGLEIRSVNSRFLDLSFRVPDELRALEPALRALITAKLKRGKVELRAAIEGEDAGSLPDPAPRLLQRLNTLQDAVKAWLPQATPLSVADALRLCASASAQSDQDWSEIAPTLAEIANEQKGKLAIGKLNVDDNPDTARRFDVMSIPTLLVFKDGQQVKRLVGAKGKGQLLQDLAEFIA